jgi:hypothetical protein
VLLIVRPPSLLDGDIVSVYMENEHVSVWDYHTMG